MDIGKQPAVIEQRFQLHLAVLATSRGIAQCAGQLCSLSSQRLIGIGHALDLIANVRIRLDAFAFDASRFILQLFNTSLQTFDHAADLLAGSALFVALFELIGKKLGF